MATDSHDQTTPLTAGVLPGAARGIRTKRDWRSDDGIATTEYALVTVAAAGFAGLLIVLLKSPEVRDLLFGIVRSALGGG